ncbi:hypothetical protein DFH08DRAFT_888826 [Mycena albidolilacea]|uniref:Uncharacterized protein n=1 Tax=Mycena albidolilacea TaxID=1033008 RepID=A0AAD7EG81_9AGAR|nr:hypothetical protein DFH08DRAFT_888826 [Mycena albidolilacea]
MSLAEHELPVKLECKIFEIATQLNSTFIPTLLLVAHRVKTWLEPMLYSIVVFSDPIDGHVCFDPVRFGSAIQSQTISEHVKNLFKPYKNFLLLDLNCILASCSAVQNLKGLTLIPNLIHLAFLIESVLAACPALQILVSLHWGFKGISYEGISLEPLSQDTDNFWIHAEKFIAQRVSGQVDHKFRWTFSLQEQ